MFRRPVEIDPRAEAALREQMLSLAAPEATPGFDARVHAALAEGARGSGTRRSAAAVRDTQHALRNTNFWSALRPALSAAALSLIVTLALLRGLSPEEPAAGLRSAGNKPAVSYGRVAGIGAAELRVEMASLGMGR
jgi:hypothetical protein